MVQLRVHLPSLAIWTQVLNTLITDTLCWWQEVLNIILLDFFLHFIWLWLLESFWCNITHNWTLCKYALNTFRNSSCCTLPYIMMSIMDTGSDFLKPVITGSGPLVIHLRTGKNSKLKSHSFNNSWHKVIEERLWISAYLLVLKCSSLISRFWITPPRISDGTCVMTKPTRNARESWQAASCSMDNKYVCEMSVVDWPS